MMNALTLLLLSQTSPPPAPPPGSTPVMCGGEEIVFPNVDHGLVCGGCKVLVDNFQSYGSCYAYCRSMGRACVAAWEEQGDSCAEQYEMMCEDNAGGRTSDALCECSADTPLPPENQPPPVCATTEVACGGSEAAFPNVKSPDGATVPECGECKVLVNRFQSYGSCRAYCATMGRTCVSAADDSRNSCTGGRPLTNGPNGCDDNAGGRTSDAICECSASVTLSPSPPPPNTCGDTIVPCGGTTTFFPDVDHGRVCGDCKVLVDNFQTYGNCSAYCGSMGRTCVSAAEEQYDSCTPKYQMDCGSNAGGSTSDALCQCSPDDPIVVPTSNFDGGLFAFGLLLGVSVPLAWVLLGLKRWRESKAAEQLPYAGMALGALGLFILGVFIGLHDSIGNFAAGIVVGVTVLAVLVVAFRTWQARKSGGSINVKSLLGLSPQPTRSRTNPLAAADQSSAASFTPPMVISTAPLPTTPSVEKGTTI